MLHRAIIVLVSASLGLTIYFARQQSLGSPLWVFLLVVSGVTIISLARILLRQSDRATEDGGWRLLEDVGLACTICGCVLLLTGGGGFRILLGGLLAIGWAVRHRFTEGQTDSSGCE
jgi:hypothetical protein